MKKLKITSPFKIIVIILFIFSVIQCIYKINNQNVKNYEKNIITTGTIQECHQKQDYVNLVIKNNQKLLVNYPNSFQCKLGIKVRVIGKLSVPPNNTIFNQFNYKNYLLSKKIKYQINAKKIIIMNKKTKSIYKFKNNIIDKINKFDSKEYMYAFIIGSTEKIDKEVYESYQYNGINHLLAISGMHISLISFLLLFILNKILPNKKVNYILLILILTLYIFLTNFSPSVIRAFLMFIILTIKKEYELKIDTIYILLLICSGYMLYNSFIVYNIGFLYSFIITAHLIIFSKFINKKEGYLKKSLYISIIAFVASAPITIINFHSINLLTPFINLIFIPIISYIIYPLSLLTLFIPSLDIILNKAISLIENLSLTISKIDNLNLILKHINIYIALLYYLIINIILKNIKIAYPLFAIILLIHSNINYLDKTSELTMIDVNQADSILIKLPHKKGNILVDCGGNINFKTHEIKDLSKSRIIPYLKSEGINQIDYLIITHGDEDHIGSAKGLIQNYKVKNIFINSKKDNRLEKEIIKLSANKTIPIKKINEATLKISKYKFRFLKNQNQTTENNDSLIVYTRLNNKNILLMGDAEKEREKEIINAYKLPQMDIIKIGHHGSKTSTSPEFVNRVRPKISLISSGLNNLYGHPHKQTLKRLENSKILITQIDGSVKLKLKKRIIYSTCPLQR